MLNRSFAIISNIIQKENTELYRWSILFYGIGIVLGLFCTNYTFFIFLVLCSACIIYTFCNYKQILIFLLFFYIGFAIGFYKTISIKNQNFFNRYINDIKITGQIESIKLTNSKTVSIIKNIKSSLSDINQGKIKLNFTDDEMMKKLSIGDIIEAKVDIWQSKLAIFPNDNSYVNYARYNNIVAQGKIKQILNFYNDSNSSYITKKVDRVRRDIQQRIYEQGGNSSGAGVIIAILTGNTAFISEHNIEGIRRSGCAHILAISGLHISIITAIFLNMFIRFFAFFQRLYLYYNTKKIASIFTIFVCFFYILISGAPVSAVRSFLMFGVVIYGIITDRIYSSMSILFFTFFLITLFNPEYILSPSLQMSFIAVLSLIAVYNSNIKQIINIKNRYLQYIFNIIFTSFGATFATAFYEIYHFKQYAWIGIISNIFVIPLTEFIALPISFLGMIFHNIPFISNKLYFIASNAGDIICIICNFFTSFSSSFVLMKQMPSWCIAVISLCLVLLYSMKSNIRLIALPIILAVMVYYYNIPNPDVIIIKTKKINNFIFKESENIYCSERQIENSYIKKIVLQNLGIDKIHLFNESICLNTSEKKIENYANRNKDICLLYFKNNKEICL